MSTTLLAPEKEKGEINEQNGKVETLDWPARTNEHWRFGQWKEANLSGLQPVGEGLPAPLPEPLEGATRFVFQNAQLIAGEHPAVTLRTDSFGPQSRLGSPKIAALHTAESTHGLTIKADSDAFIEIIHLVSGEGLLLPTLLIEALPNVRLKVVERFLSADSAPTTVVSAVELILHQNAHLSYLVTQELNSQTKLIRLADSSLETSAQARQLVVHTGARWLREETYSTVDGPESRSEIMSVTLPTTGQHYDQRTFQHHGGRNTFSDLLFKNTLFGSGETIFSGLIFVDEGAHGTDAYQSCRNLMMTDDCLAHSMPGLEINADDVKCSHGSTTARVSDEEIFYLQARGIPAHQARSLVAEGFSSETIAKLQDPTLEALASQTVARKFATTE